MAFSSLAQRIRLDAAHAAVIGKINAQMVRRGEADNFQCRAGADRDAHRKHARPHGDFAGAVLDKCAPRDFRATGDPGEDFRESVPKVDKWRKDRELVRQHVQASSRGRTRCSSGGQPGLSVSYLPVSELASPPPKPSSPPSCKTKPICSKFLCRPLYQSSQRFPSKIAYGL